jgi:hypothetical protein
VWLLKNSSPKAHKNKSVLQTQAKIGIFLLQKALIPRSGKTTTKMEFPENHPEYTILSIVVIDIL